MDQEGAEGEAELGVREGDGAGVGVGGGRWMVAEEREGKVEDVFSEGDLGGCWGVEGIVRRIFRRSACCSCGSEAADVARCIGGGEEVGED